MEQVLERLVAGLVVIGLILWGASILATPGRDAPTEQETRPDAPVDIEPDPDDEDDEHDDEDDDRREERKKRKRASRGND